ncbi:MAG TPA: VCBS repeat-containing protein [Gemmatimonadaceae bacterium]|nr:VCBS repeat-containing protein [Gemmatimonadaceae bacterium]
MVGDGGMLTASGCRIGAAAGAAAVFAALISAGACAGGGASDSMGTPTSPSTPAGPKPTVTITVDRSDVSLGAAAVATWSSTNATSCTASGGWTGARAASGTESVTITKDATLSLTCTNSAGSASASAAVTTIVSTFNLPPAYAHWRPSVGDIDGDGDWEILLPTIDTAGLYAITPPTPMFVLGVTNQRVVDKTTALFPGGAPKLYAGRVFIGDFDGNGRMDLQTCDRGRDPSRGAVPLPNNSPTLTKGTYVSQDQVFLQGTDGKFTDYTSVYPQVLQDAWGCSSGDIDKSGRESIVQSTWGPQQGFPATWVAKWNGSAFVKTRDLLPQFSNASYPNALNWGWTATADFDKNGYADIVGTSTILWGDAAGGTYAAMTPSQLVLAGYNFNRGSAIADFNGDGYPDLVLVTSKPPSAAEGEARFTLFLGGPNKTLTERVGAFPSITTYNPSDFAVEVDAIDISFDGKPDIVTTGHVYQFQGTDREPRAVWLNNGDGTFRLSHVSDELEGSMTCATPGQLKYFEAYYLKTKDPQAFNYVITGCIQPYRGSPGYVARRVTPAFPLRFTP